MRDADELVRNGIRVDAIGRLANLSPRIQTQLADLISRTESNDEMRLTFALSYGGRAEIVDAVRSIARAVERGRARARGDRREVHPGEPVLQRHARSGSPDPHRRRAPHLELPALAARLHGVLHERRALAGLHASRSSWTRCAPTSSASAASAAPRAQARGNGVVKRLALLGSTGSIGTQTLDVAARFPDSSGSRRSRAGRSVDLLVQQCKQFRPELGVGRARRGRGRACARRSAIRSCASCPGREGLRRGRDLRRGPRDRRAGRQRRPRAGGRRAAARPRRGAREQGGARHWRAARARGGARARARGCCRSTPSTCDRAVPRAASAARTCARSGSPRRAGRSGPGERRALAARDARAGARATRTGTWARRSRSTRRR